MRGAIGYGLSSALIGKTAARLAELSPGHNVARLSTDVLGLAFEAKDLEDARRIAGEMHAALQAPVELDDNAIDVSLTLGLAALGVHAPNPAGLIERANIALDQARAAGQKAAFFNAGSYGDPSTNLSLMSEMRRGVTAGELVLHHQPKYGLRAGCISGVEALVRWRHPTRGMMTPDSFIPMAEETGHIGFLTEWVLAQAIADQKALLEAGHALPISVNISGRLLGDVEFAGRALALAAKAPGHICFEITETAVIENPEMALQILDGFVRAGLSIAIDDYGTGFSSLSYLRQIRADELKIDKSFILGMEEGQNETLLVRSTVELAHSLGLKVTAEGVETAVALSLLNGMGCDNAQGYLIARPMPMPKLLAYMARQAEAAAGPTLLKAKA
jgi:EAL domain-containing protein (putative c-di-GMP-specific phosphodiesterase class I)